MTSYAKWSLITLRITLGWMFFYAGITKIVNPEWSAEGYLKGAKMFSGFYTWLTSPSILPFTDAVNEWGLTLLGASLILGLFVRLSAPLGALLMLLYYFPILDFPYPNTHAYIVDEHIIYAAALLVLSAFRAGRVGGLETWCSNLPICARFPRLRKWLG